MTIHQRITFDQIEPGMLVYHDTWQAHEDRNWGYVVVNKFLDKPQKNFDTTWECIDCTSNPNSPRTNPDNRNKVYDGLEGGKVGDGSCWWLIGELPPRHLNTDGYVVVVLTLAQADALVSYLDDEDTLSDVCDAVLDAMPYE